MADPITWAVVAGSAVSALGAVQQAQAGRAESKYNQRVAEQNAVASRDAARVEEERHRIQSGKALGQMRANYGASGVSIDGSIEDVLADSATQAEWDSLLIRHGGEQRARGYTSEANLAGARAKNVSTSGYLMAAGDLASGAARGYDYYKRT